MAVRSNQTNVTEKEEIMLKASDINTMSKPAVEITMKALVERKLSGQLTEEEQEKDNFYFKLLENRLDILNGTNEPTKIEKTKRKKPRGSKSIVEQEIEEYSPAVLAFLDDLPAGYGVTARVIADSIKYEPFSPVSTHSEASSLRHNVLVKLLNKRKIFKFSKVLGRGDLYCMPNKVQLNEDGKQSDLFMLEGKQLISSLKKPNGSDNDG